MLQSVFIFCSYSKCHKYVPFGYGCVCEPQKICHRLRGRPQIDNKDCTGGYDKRLRERNSLGLHGFHGCGYAAVDEGQVIISAVHIRTHTQTMLTNSIGTLF